MQIALKAFDYDVIVTGDGRETVEMANSHSPQLILMDLMLPGLDGIEAARRIRKNPEMQFVPIVAITAAFGPEIRKKCLDHGFNAFLPKPFSIRDLKNIIDDSLKAGRRAKLEKQQHGRTLAF